MATGRRSGEARCEDCFFHKNMLCAVSQAGPCATFRPAKPEGLRPPSQMQFVFRQERRLQVAWAFPSADEQVSLHAEPGPRRKHQPAAEAGLAHAIV